MSSEAFAALLDRMTRAICAGDGAGAAACFTDERIVKSVRRWAARPAR